jgi:hypothetical protein
MSVILQAWCQLKRTSPSLRYVNFGPGHIQCIYSSAYSVFNIHLNVSALILYISRQFNVGYTANLVPNTAHIVQFTLCEMWCRTYTKYLQLRIFMLQNSAVSICAAIVEITWILCALYCKFGVKYSAHRPVYVVWIVVPDYTKYLPLRIFMLQCSAVGICAAIVDITSIQCALYCKLGAKYSAHPPVYAIWTVVPAIYKVFTAPDSQATIFNWTYLRCNWRYSNTSMRVILQTWCQIQRTTPSLRYVNCGFGHIQSICCSAYFGLNIQLKVALLLLEVSRQFNARYTENMVPNAAHILRFTLCELWTWPYTR